MRASTICGLNRLNKLMRTVSARARGAANVINAKATSHLRMSYQRVSHKDKQARQDRVCRA
jgi:hypothetical protein